MKTLFWQINVALDGFHAGSNGELGDTAEVVDPDFERYCGDMLDSSMDS